MRKVFKGIFDRYFDYDIVGSYLEYKNGRFVRRYIKHYKLRERR